MDNLMIQALNQNLNDLSQNLPILHILRYLRVADIFDTSDYELVMNDAAYRTSAEKRIKIVDLLRSRQPRAYWMFTHYIRESSPHNFRSLHDIDVQPGCTVCADTDDDDDNLHDCQYRHYCRGTPILLSQHKIFYISFTL
jgi:Caspase recruitment domain.